MPHATKTHYHHLECRACGRTWERVVTRGRPPVTCPPCKVKEAKREKMKVIKTGGRGDNRARGNRGGSGRGNVKLRACGCPTRKHRESCPKSRVFSPPKEDEIHEKIAWVNRRKLERREAARKRAAAKVNHAINAHALQPVTAHAAALPAYISCVECKARGLIRDFKMWSPAQGNGLCNPCSE